MGVSPPASLRCAGSGGDQVETQMELPCDFAKERGCSKGGAEGRRVGFRERVSSQGGALLPALVLGARLPIAAAREQSPPLCIVGPVVPCGPEGEEALGSRVALADTRPAAGAAHLRGGPPRGPVSTPTPRPHFCSDRLTKQ